ncbi:MAG: DUF192 domain-containing protein [Bacillota bacterium]
MEEAEVRLFSQKLGVPVARTFWQRLTGLIWRSDLCGMYFPHCGAVHTFFMPAPLDVVFFDGKGEVVKVFRSVPPNRVLAVRGACSVLELKEGLLSGEDSD